MTGYFLKIPGKPTGQPRPRITSRGAFKTKAATTRESLIQQIALAAGVQPIDGPVDLAVRVIQPLPQSWSKADKLARAGRADVRKPDLDNIAKQIADALNGIAYADDCQVASLHIEKMVALPNEQPETLVWIKSLGAA